MMKNSVTGIALACLGALAAAPASAQDVDAVLTKNNCLACHAVDKKLVGPSYKDIAAKYRGQAGAEKMLAEKILKGSTGVWGQMPMPPNAAVPEADVNAMVKWILSR